MGFTKLDSGIVNSSVWNEPAETRVLWITILAMSDENGFVSSSRSGLNRAANISQEKFDAALTTLESEDIESRTPDFKGRRIEKVDGGWMILNFLKYRARYEIIKEQTRERVKKFRDKQQDVTLCNVTETLPSASASASASGSASGFKEGMQGGKKIEYGSRAIKFKSEIDGFAENYSAPMLKDFFEYWSEPNRSKTKMRFELETTWDLTKRLARWEKNNHEFASRGKNELQRGYPGNNRGKPEYDENGIAFGAQAKPGEFDEGIITLDGVPDHR
jgi:hypothetical protein